MDQALGRWENIVFKKPNQIACARALSRSSQQSVSSGAVATLAHAQSDTTP